MDKPWFVYIVSCNDGTLYTGISNNVDARIKTHNSGKGAKYTKTRTPVKLVWKRFAGTKSLALKLEHKIKSKNRAEKLRIIEQDAL